ncbi:MAG: hypothetical protein AAF602_23790, partial [Myxococcota bacterium]
ILVTPHGEVKIVDFGGARGNFTQREAQTVDVAYGSPGYVAPERLDAVEGPAGDVFSLGFVFLELLAAKHVDAGELRRKSHDQRVEKLVEYASARAPEAAVALATSMVAWDRELRPTAKEVEREARNIRSMVQDPWLSEWAEAAIARLPKRDVEAEHDFSDSVLYEHADGPKLGTPDLPRRAAASTLHPEDAPIPRLSKEPTLPPGSLTPPPSPPSAMGQTARPRMDSRHEPLSSTSRPRRVDPNAKTIMSMEPRSKPINTGWSTGLWFLVGLALVVFGAGILAVVVALVVAVNG